MADKTSADKSVSNGVQNCEHIQSAKHTKSVYHSYGKSKTLLLLQQFFAHKTSED